MIMSATYTRIGVELGTGEPVNACLTPRPELLRHGVIRPAALVLMIDMVAGVAAEGNVGTDWVFTTDLSCRLPLTDLPDRIVGTAGALRVGRGSVTNEVLIEADGRDYAYGQAGFIRLPRRHGDPEKPHLNETEPRVIEPLDQPLVEAAGVDVVDAATGRVEVELADGLRNPAGAMQGSMVSLTAEVAAEALAEHHLGMPHRISAIDIRYLAMARVGPVRSLARWIGDPEHGAVRIELRDAGAGDRLTAAVLVQLAPL